MATRGVNKVILVGNVGQDPDTRYMPSGGAICRISLATSETWKDKNTGQNQERTEWHQIVFFNKLAEIVNQYVRKGHKLYVEGSLRTRSWEQDGIKRYATEIIGSDMQMLGSPNGPANDYPEYQQGANQNTGATRQQGGQQQQNTARQQGGSNNQQPSNYHNHPHDYDNFDDDIPF